ncbi:MAG: type II toxin-antitoxin system VapC family toxin [Candidatus Asgardarchaeia archaeon]
MIVLDTDVLINFLRGDLATKDILFSINEPLATTVINAYELMRGAITIKKQKTIKEFIETINLLPLDKKATFIATDIYLHLRKSGTIINELDILIAAITVANDGTLFTYNIRHFERIPQLNLLKV